MDRSFVVTVLEENGNVLVRFAETDTGREYMTTVDVAAYLDRDSRTIRRWRETRAQRQVADPIPFFRLYGELRFERTKIVAWQKRQSDAEQPLALEKGRRKQP